MPIEDDDVDYQQRMSEVRKNKGIIIKTTYDDDGKPIRSEAVRDADHKDKQVEPPKSIRGKLKDVGGKFSKALKKKEMTEAEIDESIRITNKKATLQKAKRRLADERRETIRSNINTFGQFVRTDLPKGKKNGGGGGSFGMNDWFGMQDSGKKPINNNFNYYDWTFGGMNRKPSKSGKDWAKDFYGI